MHGTMLCGLRHYLVEEYGEETWDEALSTAAVPTQLFVPVTEYPDRYYHELVEAVVEVTGQEVAAIERALGRQLVVDLVGEEPTSADDGLALLADVGAWTSPAFGADQRGHLEAVRLDDYRVRLTYDCPNGLCRVVRGVVDGITALAGTDVVVQESECMHDGDRRCTFMVTAAASATTGYGRSPGGAPGVTD
jgi:hypothetical protein